MCQNSSKRLHTTEKNALHSAAGVGGGDLVQIAARGHGARPSSVPAAVGQRPFEEAPHLGRNPPVDEDQNESDGEDGVGQDSARAHR